MGIGEEEEEVERIRCYNFSIFLLEVIVYCIYRGQQKACHGALPASDLSILGKLGWPPGWLLSHFFEVADWLVSFSAGDFLYICPKLAAGWLEVFSHFLPKRFRPVIEQRKSEVEQILIIMSLHFLIPVKGDW
jgi:hypothetical protein